MTKVMVFTVTYNEYDLIEDWILHYANLFGLENLVIIDNGSDDKRVLDVYKKYPVKLFVKPGFSGESQGQHFTSVMLQFKNECNFLLGADTDEFLVERIPNDIGMDKATILSEIEKIPQHRAKLIINTHINSCSCGVPRLDNPTEGLTKFMRTDLPVTNEYKGPSFHYEKVFYKASKFQKTFNGNHDGLVSEDTSGYYPLLAFLHFHDLGYERNFERAYKTVVNFDYIGANDDKDTIIKKLKERGSGGYGCHRVNEVLRYYDKGERRFNNSYNFKTSKFSQYIKALK